MANKKKVRGFKRHLKDHQLRAAAPITPIRFPALAQHHYEYDWLGLAPWRVNEKPPYPIRRLWVAHLVAGFFSWQCSLQNYLQDYFLAVCIKEPDFADSRLRVGIEEWKTRYQNEYSEPEDMLPFPQEYHDIAGVTALHWTTHRRLYIISLEEFQDDLARGEKHRNYWPCEGDNGEPMMMVQVGWEWVGRVLPVI